MEAIGETVYQGWQGKMYYLDADGEKCWQESTFFFGPNTVVAQDGGGTKGNSTGMLLIIPYHRVLSIELQHD